MKSPSKKAGLNIKYSIYTFFIGKVELQFAR